MNDGHSTLFSYGTLQQDEVQRANYGRLLKGTPDLLVGYRLRSLEIDDPEVVRISGKSVHTLACFTGDSSDRVPGTRFEITAEELAATDSYEVGAYKREDVALESGYRAYCYVARQEFAE